MKTERRHELQTNVLADQLGRSINTVRPYSSTITLVLVIGVVVILTVLYITRQSARQAGEAWANFYQATADGTDVDLLEQTIKEHPNTPVSDWAQLAIADDSLSRGTALLLRDKSGAKTHLTDAAERYRELSTKAKVDDVRQRALFNLGLAYESLGQVEEAVQAYESVEGVLAEVAKLRAEAAKKSDVKEFYDWFVKAEPATPFLPGHGLMPGERPEFDVESPADSPFRLPGNITDPLPPTGDVELPSAFDPPASTPAPEAPAAEPESSEAAATPAEPAAEVPAPETAAPEAPAEESTAPEAPAAEAADAPATPQQ